MSRPVGLRGGPGIGASSDAGRLLIGCGRRIAVDDMAFTDALTGHVIAVSADGGAARVVEKRRRGCSVGVLSGLLDGKLHARARVGYAGYLAGAGIAQGVSLLCCGKILDFEEGGAARRDHG